MPKEDKAKLDAMNIITGTGEPPDPSTVPEGTIYFRYV
jgi:hypothetical protein